MTHDKRLPVAVILVLSIISLMHGPGLAQDTTYFTPDMLAIHGHWVRDDAPYVIGLKQGKDTTLQATYFNRRFIHVEKTETAVKDGVLYLMIELQDVNYQGSVYLLRYDRNRDVLQGIYIHGASGQRYQVRFARQTSP